VGEGRNGRRRRADGEESRRRILDAAAEIAGERGYEGTSIATVSARSGLPASSIYWYFEDKDALIAAVIERSFDRWLAAMSLPGPKVGSTHDRMTAMAVAVAKALLDTPDFLRLGLMLALERRPTEPTARAKFLQVRQVAHQHVTEAARELAPELSEASVRRLATYALAGADGLFIAREIGGDDVDLIALFELHARTLIDIVAHELAEQPARQSGRGREPARRTVGRG
jgi:AcrR family transcriptional regulator